MTSKFTELNFRDGYHNVTIQRFKDEYTADLFVEDFIRPLMLALGYHPDSVNEVLNSDED